MLFMKRKSLLRVTFYKVLVNPVIYACVERKPTKMHYILKVTELGFWNHKPYRIGHRFKVCFPKVKFFLALDFSKRILDVKKSFLLLHQAQFFL